MENFLSYKQIPAHFNEFITTGSKNYFYKKYEQYERVGNNVNMFITDSSGMAVDSLFPYDTHNIGGIYTILTTFSAVLAKPLVSSARSTIMFMFLREWMREKKLNSFSLKAKWCLRTFWKIWLTVEKERGSWKKRTLKDRFFRFQIFIS